MAAAAVTLHVTIDAAETVLDGVGPVEADALTDAQGEGVDDTRAVPVPSRVTGFVASADAETVCDSKGVVVRVPVATPDALGEELPRPLVDGSTEKDADLVAEVELLSRDVADGVCVVLGDAEGDGDEDRVSVGLEKAELEPLLVTEAVSDGEREDDTVPLGEWGLVGVITVELVAKMDRDAADDDEYVLDVHVVAEVVGLTVSEGVAVKEPVVETVLITDFDTFELGVIVELPVTDDEGVAVVVSERVAVERGVDDTGAVNDMDAVAGEVGEIDAVVERDPETVTVTVTVGDTKTVRVVNPVTEGVLEADVEPDCVGVCDEDVEMRAERETEEVCEMLFDAMDDTLAERVLAGDADKDGEPEFVRETLDERECDGEPEFVRDVNGVADCDGDVDRLLVGQVEIDIVKLATSDFEPTALRETVTDVETLLEIDEEPVIVPETLDERECDVEPEFVRDVNGVADCDGDVDRLLVGQLEIDIVKLATSDFEPTALRETVTDVETLLEIDEEPVIVPETLDERECEAETETERDTAGVSEPVGLLLIVALTRGEEETKDDQVVVAETSELRELDGFGLAL